MLVDFRGLLEDISAPQQLLLTGSAENQRQEFRIFFAEPIDEVYGVELIECPNDGEGPCQLSTIASRAYYLGANRERIEEIGIGDFNRGSIEE